MAIGYRNNGRMEILLSFNPRRLARGKETCRRQKRRLHKPKLFSQSMSVVFLCTVADEYGRQRTKK